MQCTEFKCTSMNFGKRFYLYNPQRKKEIEHSHHPIKFPCATIDLLSITIAQFNLI